MRTLGFDKIAGSNVEQWSVSDTGLVEAMHREVQSNPCSSAINRKRPETGLFIYSQSIYIELLFLFTRLYLKELSVYWARNHFCHPGVGRGPDFLKNKDDMKKSHSIADYL
jgi:hypothetical protein